jgi:hypothetical protein
MRLLTGLTGISLAILISGVTAIDEMPTATALPTQGTLMARSRLKFRTGVRSSRYRVGGFSRSGITCAGTPAPAALVPPPQSQEQVTTNRVTVDKTTSDHPTLFVYLPSLAAKTAQFTLQNEASTEQLHSVEFTLSGKPGIVGIALPNSVPALQVGQKYLWQVAIACDPDEPSGLMVISSWIERVKPPVTTASTNRLTALAEQGIWQDVLTQVAMQRYQQPRDRATAEDWATLMEEAGLPQFKQSEIVQIVKN